MSRTNDNGGDRCQYNSQDLVNSTLHDNRSLMLLRRHLWKLKSWMWFVTILGLDQGSSRILSSTRLGTLLSRGNSATKSRASSLVGGAQTLGLRSGDWVTVKSAKEIYSTLDERSKLNGLTFTPEMAKFCGKQFRVFKVLIKIIVESTGELRRIKTPTVLLDGVFCDGTAHGNCDRSCLCFWREPWLERTPLQSNA